MLSAVIAEVFGEGITGGFGVSDVRFDSDEIGKLKTLGGAASPWGSSGYPHPLGLIEEMKVIVNKAHERVD